MPSKCRISIGIFLCLSVFTPASVIAKTTDLNFWMSVKSRKEKAEEWKTAFANLNAQIPSLSPAEEAWLKTEIDDTMKAAGNRYTKRALDAQESKEYQCRLAKPHVQEIIKTLDLIIDADPTDRREEVLQWARLTSLFIDVEFWQAVRTLVDRGIVGKTINGADQYYLETHIIRAQLINNLVVIYL